MSLRKVVSVFLFSILFCPYSKGGNNKPLDSVQPDNTVDLTAGIGSNLFSIIFSQTKNLSVRVTPVIGTQADFWVGRNLSVGPALAYQRITFIDTSNGVNQSLSINRTNAGARILLHTTQKPDATDYYFGFRLAYDIYDARNNRAFSQDLFLNMFMHQLVVGGKYNIKNKYLIFSELGIGPPYFFALGAGIRL